MSNYISKISASILIVLFFIGTGFSGDINAYFAPNGGFDAKNKNRVIIMKDGTQVKATLSNGLMKMIEDTKSFGTIKICMYAMGDMATVDALIKAASNRHIKVKLLLDACADWTKDIRTKILARVKKAGEKSIEDKKDFDFQVKLITRDRMEDRGRTRTLKDGTVIYGTMHEKFGVFYSPKSKVPYNSFAGSSNVSKGSDQIFAENRIFFYDNSTVARQFQEEFARLWNEYGSCAVNKCQSEMYIEAYPAAGDVRVVFNGEPITEDSYNRIDEELEKIINKVTWKNGSIDIAMFSFTNKNLAEAIVRSATKKKGAKFRILLDMTQLIEDESHMGVLGPWFEQQAEKKGLKNLEVRYKWRSNAFGWDKTIGAADLLHTQNLLLHHKLMIVNKNIMATGSYNWSSSAEERNLENIMIFKRSYKNHGETIDRFLSEFDAIWNSLKPAGIVKEAIKKAPQSIKGPRGRELREKIIALLGDENNREIMKAVARKFITSKDLSKIVEISKDKLNIALKAMEDATLISKSAQNGIEGYELAD